MNKGIRHIRWGAVVLFFLLVLVPCGAQEDAVQPPKEPVSPEVEKVKEAGSPDETVEKTDKKEARTDEEKQKVDSSSEPVEKLEDKPEDKPEKKPATRDSTPVDDEEPARAEAAREKEQVKDKPAGNTAGEQPGSAKKEEAPGVERELLSIAEGPFKYRRIAGIELEETVSSEQILANTEDQEEVSKEEAQGSGLFGMDKETTDIVAWIILGLIIFLVFILYRVRARERPGRVLRRFPKV